MAFDIFLKLDGITGEAQDSVHKESIDILSWSWNVSQSGTVHLGGGAGTGKATVGDINVIKYVDLASPTLALFCASGKHIATGKLTIRKAGDKPLEYLVYDLETIMISGIQVGGSSGGDERLTESVSLNFAKMKGKYTQQGADGAAGSDNSFEYNIPTSEWS